MVENSKIEWCDHTFSPWVGCTKVSAACDHCYAESWAKRTGQGGLWLGERRRTTEGNWRLPVKWNRNAAELGIRYRVFCASLSDVFDNQVPDVWRSDLWALIEDTPYLDWLLLTKRPQNVRKMIWPKWDAGMPTNIWLGTTVENQAEAERRIPHLLKAPAHIKFLSCEPLLGPILLRDDWAIDVDWIITGGESGPCARPTNPQWFRDIRDQCDAAGIWYLHKQNGEFVSVSEVAGNGLLFTFEDGRTVRRLGKKLSGRTLDGLTHDEFPGMI